MNLFVTIKIRHPITRPEINKKIYPMKRFLSHCFLLLVTFSLITSANGKFNPDGQTSHKASKSRKLNPKHSKPKIDNNE
jgi:TPR repeat protein